MYFFLMLLFYEDYFNIFLLFIISFGLACIILGASYFFSVQRADTEKTSVYECGFNPYEDSRNKFEIRFFTIAILFLIFDLEALFLFPWAISLNQINSFGFWSMIDFLIELFVGYIYVWKIGALTWS
jgi:NADH:ubiquinone oxidoreductase subunit 3 (subunit A)